MWQSVVKVFAVNTSPNFLQPWQSKTQRECTGTAFAVSNRQLITNAHVVADQSFVSVRRFGDSQKYAARVVAAGHECDLACLEVDDEVFWNGLSPLPLGGLPELQDEVVVLGFPTGGDSLSVTQGVVSRVEPQLYAHGATTLLAIQIDAAINPGNSGGPVLKDNSVVRKSVLTSCVHSW